VTHRVLLFTAASSAGVQKNIVQIANYLDSSLYEVTVAASNPEAISRKVSEHVHVRSLGLGEERLRLADWRAAQNLTSDIDQNRYDIVHAHGVREAVIATLAIARARHTPKLILTIHRFLPNAWTNRFGLAAMWKRWLGQRLVHVIAVSDSLRMYVMEGWNVPDRRVTTIYNAAELQPAVHARFCKKIFGVPHEGYVVGTIGRLVAEKGVDRLIDAVLILRRMGVRVHLVVIGDGPVRDQLQKYASKRGLYAIHWMGERDDASGLLRGFDLFVMPSHAEGLGVAAIEAMMAGVPVLASSVGGLPEAIGVEAAGRSGGKIMNNPTASNIAESIYQLLKNPLERKKMGQAGQLRAADCFSVYRMTEQVAEIYRTCLSQDACVETLDVHA